MGELFMLAFGFLLGVYRVQIWASVKGFFGKV